LLVRTLTWLRPSDELFDFDNINMKNYELATRIEGYLIKENSFIVKFIDEKDIKITDLRLIKIEIKEDSFYLRICHDLNLGNVDKIPWMVIRNMKSVRDEKDYKLSVGDILKFGRVKLKITEIRLQDNLVKEKYISENERNDMLITKSEKITIQENLTRNFTIIQSSHMKIPSKVLSSTRNTNNCLSVKGTIDEEKLKKKKICRICLEENESNDNTNVLLSPCKCSGSSKYIHFNCLQTWLKSKAIINYLITSNCNYYELKSIECEICKAFFPGKYVFNQIQSKQKRISTKYMTSSSQLSKIT
jgi:hypothetical protein